MTDRSDWAARLAAAVAAQVAQMNQQQQAQAATPQAPPLRGGHSLLVLGSSLPEDRITIQLHSIKATSTELVEVIYSLSTDPTLKGIQIDLASVLSGSERIKDSSVEELAFDLINLGMFEPRPLAIFLPPDSNGVRWLPLHRWLDVQGSDWFTDPKEWG